MGKSTGTRIEIEDGKLESFLEALLNHSGFDYRDYSPASLKRRIRMCMMEEQLNSLSAFQEKVLHDPDSLERLLKTFSINVTAMFRNPAFYRAFRDKVVPRLKTYPHLRVWIAGCSTGEEVYYVAILLKEQELYEKTNIYATDSNVTVLEQAKTGIFPLSKIKQYSLNYLEAGGSRSLADYYTARYDNALFDSALAKNVIWAQHNLVTDWSFNDFHVIFCRNVLIYFNKSLQARAHNLFYKSLIRLGILGLGNKETIQFSPYEDNYETLDFTEKIYRKVK